MSFWVIPQLSISKIKSLVRSTAAPSNRSTSSTVKTIGGADFAVMFNNPDLASKTRGKDGMASICQSHLTNDLMLFR